MAATIKVKRISRSKSSRPRGGGRTRRRRGGRR